jgi:hypothetical protein
MKPIADFAVDNLRKNPLGVILRSFLASVIASLHLADRWNAVKPFDGASRFAFLLSVRIVDRWNHTASHNVAQ